MNVFEDLLVDLKEENLLEDTVLDERASSYKLGRNLELALQNEITPSTETLDEEPVSKGHVAVAEPDGETVTPGNDPSRSHGREFFKKRAVSEVSGLQMVEHVLTGVEREYMKMKPHLFDDLKVKLALNKFLHLGDATADSEEHKSAEFALMQETEAWCIALADRDKKITVAHLRQYCENAKPALSSQALVALCRFYRNLPYTEAVRSKFDCVITRLFSRPIANEHRVCLFKRDEALGHLQNLYKEWSSVPLYSADGDESKALLAALSFDELAEESEQASSFDQLIESDFFSRLRMFKESISELFFAPQVTISAIEANVRIGNSYVSLIAAEREKMDSTTLRSKYSAIDHEAVSDVTARTLELVDLLRSVPSELDETFSAHHEEPAERIKVSLGASGAKKETKDRDSDNAGSGSESPKVLGLKIGFKASKWIIATAVIIVSASIGLYVWANYFVEGSVPSNGVRVVSFDNTAISEHITTGKVSNETFYGVLNEGWNGLNKEKREEYVQRLLAQGGQLGYRQVSLMTKDGKPAAYGSKDKIDVEMP